MPNLTSNSYRFLMLGAEGVGKSALGVQIAFGYFDAPGYASTIEDGYRKQLSVDGQICFVELFDMNARYESLELTNAYIRQCQGFIFIYSITSRSSFERLDAFYQMSRKATGHNLVLILVGNKCDRGADREVAKEEGAALAQQLGCEFIEVSAKTSQNVEHLLPSLIRALRQIAQQREVANRLEPQHKRGSRNVLSTFMGQLRRK